VPKTKSKQRKNRTRQAKHLTRKSLWTREAIESENGSEPRESARHWDDRKCDFTVSNSAEHVVRTDVLGFATARLFAMARQTLVEAGYDLANVSKLLNGRVTLTPSESDLRELMRLTDGRSPLETVVRLFTLNVDTTLDDAQRAFGSMGLDAWANAGVVTIDGDVVTPTIRILLFKGLLVAVESAAAIRSRQQHVVADVTAGSALLAELTIRRPVRRMLDLGTGCGIQSLLAAGFCERVHATDINPRAVMFARFNASLNGLSNVAVEQGDLFEPVRGLSFDQITSNMTDVRSSEVGFAIGDGSRRDGDIVQRIIRQAPNYLGDQGFCQLMCSWAHFRNQPWRVAVADWFSGTGCDAWVMRRANQTTSDYSKTWRGDSGDADGDCNAAESRRRWKARCESAGIDSISTGLVSMRRRDHAPNWTRVSDWTGKIQGNVADDVLEGFAIQEFLERTSDDAALLRARVRVSSRTRLEQQCKPSARGWQCVHARLTRNGGLAGSCVVDLPVLNLLSRCDGRRRLGDVLVDVASTLSGDSRSIPSEYVATVRRLIAMGILQPSAFDAASSEFSDASAGRKVMVLMRGLPSCGKSHMSQRLVASGGVRYEFDEYFLTQVGDDVTRYDWSSDLLPRAREWNMNRICKSVDAGISPIIVDSDNNVGAYTREYVAHAIDRGYEIQFKEPESSWWRVICELLKDKRANADKLGTWAEALTQMSESTHRVPLRDIHRRIERWEVASVEKIMAFGAVGVPS
jgi:methyltransferase family protein/AAA domain-containing protein